MIRRIVMTCALGSLAFATAACNTVQGAGEDIESVGERGEEVVDGI